MLLCRALHMGLVSYPLFHPNLKPHLGLYNVRPCAHPKISTFVHNLLYKLTFNYKYAEIFSTYHQKNFDFPKVYQKMQLSYLMIGNCKTCRTTPK